MYEQRAIVPATEPAAPWQCLVVHFRGTSMIVHKAWLQANSYDTAMAAFKAHFGRAPGNADVLDQNTCQTGAAKYEAWTGFVYLKIQLRYQTASESQAAVIHDFSNTGAGWSDIIMDIERAYLAIM